MELAEVLAGCEEDGCFEEEFAYAVPLRPIPKVSKTISKP
jgi:hypothetical protein